MLWDVLRMTWPAAWARREPRAYQTESSQALSGEGLSSHGFVKNLKGYGREAGLAHIHLHQTRHTYARLVGELTGSVVETQDALGHRNASTTRVYLQRVAVKRDKHSSRIAERLGVGRA